MLGISILGCWLRVCAWPVVGRFLPDYIETIGIPMFDNETTAFEVEQLITQQVRQNSSSGGGSIEWWPRRIGRGCRSWRGPFGIFRFRPASFNG